MSLTNITAFFNAGIPANNGNGSASTTPATTAADTTVKRKVGAKKLPPAPYPPKKQRKKSIPANPDGFHESHFNPRSGIHYQYIRSGSYRCLRPELKEPYDPKPSCEFTFTDPNVNKAADGISSHSRSCWPNLLKTNSEYSLVRQKLNPNQHRKSSQAYRDKRRDEIVSFMTLGISPTIPCHVDGCAIMSYTTFDLSVHVYNTHQKASSSMSEFFEKSEWKIDLDLESSLGFNTHADFSVALRDHITHQIQSQTTHFYAYVVIFLPEEISTVELAWIFLENTEKETRIVYYYSGKAAMSTLSFNAENWHKKRPKSTIFEFIRDTRCRAFQLCALEFETLDESTDQESIFQLIGNCSKTTKTLRPNSINYNLINERPEGKNWLKLSDDDFNLAVNEGRSRTPLICPDMESHQPHKVRGKSFGQLHKSEVNLIPFRDKYY